MIRALLDTNVIVSAILADGTPAELMRLAGAGAFRLISSGYVLDETRTVLVSKLIMSSADTDLVLARIVRSAELVPVFQASRPWCGDPGDDAVIESALLGRAAYLVTGDRLLLKTTIDGLEMVTPAEFAALLGNE